MNASKMIYETIPVVSELNKVNGFEPRKFMRKTVSELTQQEVLYLDLKFRKLWFRLKYPKGRIKLSALKITEQLAIFEAKVFFENTDTEPVSSFVAERYAKGKFGALYIENAQNAAVGQALSDAGFGLQFCDVNQGADSELIERGSITRTADSVPVPSEEPVEPVKKDSADSVTCTFCSPSNSYRLTILAFL